MPAPNRHLVVDGSNIATEGRNLPSLQQLDDAVQAVMSERSFGSITVIVDATFAHRIEDSEKPTFEDAVDAGEIIMPPAGVVGRGDAFILQVAEKANATVMSNDSFQEFHGEHVWLFEEGRLLGGKPIEHVGWVFVDRVPVRGPASRRAVREAKDTSKGTSSRRSSSKKASSAKKSSSRSSKSSDKLEPLGAPKTPPPGGAPKPSRSRKKATGEAASNKANKAKRGSKDDPSTEPSPTKKKRSGRRSASSNAEELNDPKTFLAFISSYSIGDTVDGAVETFSSHGCYVRAAGAQCYLPSNSMGEPPPQKARDVVSRQQTVTVRVVSLDAERRGINVELIDVGAMVGDDASRQPNHAETDSVGEAPPTRSTRHMATKKAAKKAPAKKAAAKKAPAKRAAKKAPAKKAAAKKAPAKRAAAKKAPAKRAAKKAPAKKAAAKKAPAKRAAKKAPAKKAAAKKAPAKRAAKKR